MTLRSLSTGLSLGLPSGLLAGLIFGLAPSVLLLGLSAIPQAQASPSTPETKAQAAYRALLARHRSAAALDVVATVERRVEHRDGRVERLLVEGEIHVARTAAGWLRTSTVALLPAGLSGERESLPESEGDLFELMGNGQTIFEVKRRERTALALGGHWFAVFPDLSPVVAWTGVTPRDPRSIVLVEDPTGAGRMGLRIEHGAEKDGAEKDGADKRAATEAWSVGSTETLWLDDEGSLVAAEKERRTADSRQFSSFDLRSWKVSKEVDATKYQRSPPLGFDGLSVADQMEGTLAPAGKLAPPAVLRGIGPKLEDLDLESLRGTALLLTFWYAECPGAMEVLPQVESLWGELSKDREDVRFLAVALSGSALETDRIWKSMGNTYPTYSQKDDEVSRAFGVSRYPTIFVIDKSGSVLWRSSTYDDPMVRAILKATR